MRPFLGRFRNPLADLGRLMNALERFGVNTSMREAIANIYKERFFCVRDGGELSEPRPQNAGISQGCPLSPFLFGILMTVLMTDAQSMLSPEAKRAIENDSLEDILFADDTLLISTSAKHLEEYMAAVAHCGSQYGLQIHWGKVVYVPVCSEQRVQGPTGQMIEAKASMLYLGATIHGDGRFGSEISRKIGAAKEAFRSLHTLWKHAGVGKQRKVQLFEALILSKLRYATASAWLLKAELRRLDGFQASCLRQILKVPSPYISRVSNKKILELSNAQKLSCTIQDQQQQLFEKVLSSPAKKQQRQATFIKDTAVPLTRRYVQRVGRPRQNWADECAKRRR